jgi:hypothetical protein
MLINNANNNKTTFKYFIIGLSPKDSSVTKKEFNVINNEAKNNNADLDIILPLV